MYILGFNGSHDASVCLVKDGRLLGTITKERITRIKKHNNGNVDSLVNMLLARFEVHIEDIRYVSFCDDIIPGDSNNLKVLEHNDKNYFRVNNGISPQAQTCSNIVGTGTATHELFDLTLPSRHTKGCQVGHHLGHGSYSFFTSPFEKAVILSLDGSPHDYCRWMTGNKRGIKLFDFDQIHVNILYDRVASGLLNEIAIYSAGKMMGMASYGDLLPTFKYDYEAFNHNDFLAVEGSLICKLERTFTNKMNVAHTIQHIFENVIVDSLNKLPDKLVKEHDYNLCLSGGSFLNCNVNTLIKRNTKFKNIHISPACGDDGLSVGSALYVAHTILGYPREEYTNKDLMYSGSNYSIPKIENTMPYNADFIASEIAKGKIVALYQGSSEFGPRALGNRSILADPRCPKMRDYLNNEVKKREWYRPYGASVLEDHTSEWFDWDGPSPFMLFTCQVKKPDLVPAITHVDGSCRIQTVNTETNNRFYEIISEFYKQTGVPLLLNTSFNTSSEPIVETPEDALKTFNNMKINILVMEDRVLIKDADLVSSSHRARKVNL